MLGSLPSQFLSTMLPTSLWGEGPQISQSTMTSAISILEKTRKLFLGFWASGVFQLVSVPDPINVRTSVLRFPGRLRPRIVPAFSMWVFNLEVCCESSHFSRIYCSLRKTKQAKIISVQLLKKKTRLEKPPDC